MKPSRSLDIVFRTCLHVLGRDLISKHKKLEGVILRAIYYKIARDLTTDVLAEITKKVKRNHSTAVHGLKVFENDVSRSEKYFKLYEECQLRCKRAVDQSYLKTASKGEKFLHININLRARIRALENQLQKIPETIKTKYV